MRVVDLILKKKEGKALSHEEITYLIAGYVAGDIPDYQISSFLMAVCLQGLTEDEQVALTEAMLKSGEEVDLSSIDGICVDKHSTGGVGDKTTLVIAPIVASCGLKIAKMSGRGLGHTGGTIDKLESIPGYQTAITSRDFLRQVDEIGLAVVGQTANIAPADKKLYALRDVTGTVESVGLIASSIMSKKLASGAHSILLDVKVGEGAFMKTLAEAKVLAEAMVAIGNKKGRKTVAILTDMNEPLGDAVGNSLEVIEAIDTLKGKGPKRFEKLCVLLCSELLVMTGVSKTIEEAQHTVEEVIRNGKALQKLEEMISYQGGNKDVVHRYDLFEVSKKTIDVTSSMDGYVADVNALQIGNAAMKLGAGRQKKEDNIDMGVGILVKAKVGDFVNKGDILATLYVNTKGIDEAIHDVTTSFTIVVDKVEEKPIILDIVY